MKKLLLLLAFIGVLVSCGKGDFDDVEKDVQNVQISELPDGVYSLEGDVVEDDIPRGSLFTAASSAPDPTFFVDPELLPYFEEFLADALSRGFDLSYLYDRNVYIGIHESADALGFVSKCSNSRYIDMTIQRAFLNREWGGAVKWFFYHELGHALFNMGHNPGERNHIMNALFDSHYAYWNINSHLDQFWADATGNSYGYFYGCGPFQVFEENSWNSGGWTAIDENIIEKRFDEYPLETAAWIKDNVKRIYAEETPNINITRVVKDVERVYSYNGDVIGARFIMLQNQFDIGSVYSISANNPPIAPHQVVGLGPIGNDSNYTLNWITKLNNITATFKFFDNRPNIVSVIPSSDEIPIVDDPHKEISSIFFEGTTDAGVLLRGQVIIPKFMPNLVDAGELNAHGDYNLVWSEHVSNMTVTVVRKDGGTWTGRGMDSNNIPSLNGTAAVDRATFKGYLDDGTFVAGTVHNHDPEWESHGWYRNGHNSFSKGWATNALAEEKAQWIRENIAYLYTGRLGSVEQNPITYVEIAEGYRVIVRLANGYSPIHTTSPYTLTLRGNYRNASNPYVAIGDSGVAGPREISGFVVEHVSGSTNSLVKRYGLGAQGLARAQADMTFIQDAGSFSTSQNPDHQLHWNSIYWNSDINTGEYFLSINFPNIGFVEGDTLDIYPNNSCDCERFSVGGAITNPPSYSTETEFRFGTSDQDLTNLKRIRDANNAGATFSVNGIPFTIERFSWTIYSNYLYANEDLGISVGRWTIDVEIAYDPSRPEPEPSECIRQDLGFWIGHLDLDYDLVLFKTFDTLAKAEALANEVTSIYFSNDPNVAIEVESSSADTFSSFGGYQVLLDPTGDYTITLDGNYHVYRDIYCPEHQQ
ncbi:hypothetical protein [Pelagibaculum spongiae]|nr:hypothetical protein [Pelagibaculum spongiae]